MAGSKGAALTYLSRVEEGRTVRGAICLWVLGHLQTYHTPQGMETSTLLFSPRQDTYLEDKASERRKLAVSPLKYISAKATYRPELEKAGCWNCRFTPCTHTITS